MFHSLRATTEKVPSPLEIQTVQLLCFNYQKEMKGIFEIGL